MFNKTQIVVLTLALSLSGHALAAGSYSSTFKNQGNYTLQMVATWGNGCVINKGKEVLAPGESTVMTVGHNCDWGGVKYKIMRNNQTVGFVAHSYRDKKFTVEVSQGCYGNHCAFTGLPPG